MDARLQTQSVQEMVDYGRASMVRQQVTHIIEAVLHTASIKRGLEKSTHIYVQAIPSAHCKAVSYGAGIQQ